MEIEMKEIIFGNNGHVIGSQLLDPNTMTRKHDRDGNVIWIQYIDKPRLKTILNESQIEVKFKFSRTK